ncbi:MAG: radical SAM family heme chaperone HemW [Anaerolineae bacterium]|jgi:oxygen-independent coproporphyrinogen-3 oxidase|nr:radical SAM family heme chaperone HemW [Anaerolineae bacterium]MDH7473801.1 radical SAM family heme chaperone HemW [Anaerolineae bacterium]
MKQSVALYVHIPFCAQKCAYCDFNSYAGLEHLFAPYIQALTGEMRVYVARWGSLRVCTIYIGGGTPTVLPLSLLTGVLAACHASFEVINGAETTVEANPGTVDESYLAGLLAAGVNRLSLGVQSLDDSELRLLGRLHDADQAREAYHQARAVGFCNVNLDLIFGLPGQTMARWQATVRQALDLGPEHLSLYALTIEEHTPLAGYIAHGELPAPDDDLAAEMYEWAEVELAKAGYVHYEISNWAQPGFECQHNLVYWHNQPYLGLGAGAHSWLAGCRWANVRIPQIYIEAIVGGKQPVAESEEIDRALEMAETVILGLRLVEEGVNFGAFRARFGVEFTDIYGSKIEELANLGLLEVTRDRVRLTRWGRLLGNQVFQCFLPDPC